MDAQEENVTYLVMKGAVFQELLDALFILEDLHGIRSGDDSVSRRNLEGGHALHTRSYDCVF